VHDADSDAQSRRNQIGEIFQALNSIIPRITALVGRTDLAMSDSLIIQAVFIAIGPFFVVDSGSSESKSSRDREKNSFVLTTLGGAVSLRGLRLLALLLIKCVRTFPSSADSSFSNLLSGI